MKFDMKYYNTYYYCNIACNIIQYGGIDWAPTLVQFSEPFFEEEPKNFNKYSMLHSFCYYLAGQIIREETEAEISEITDRYDLYTNISKVDRIKKAFKREDLFEFENPQYVLLEIERAMKQYDNKSPLFIDWLLENDFNFIEDALMEYEFENIDLYSDTLDSISNEMFYILFQNREFLLHFNYYMSCTSPYKMERVYVPEWVKRAVFFRDRGNCAICGKDLSGLIDICDDADKHYDHIIPLNNNGLNDISNMQLLCKDCNLVKGESIQTGPRYTNWYDIKL